jgi:hypothetical protein
LPPPSSKKKDEAPQASGARPGAGLFGTRQFDPHSQNDPDLRPTAPSNNQVPPQQSPSAAARAATGGDGCVYDGRSNCASGQPLQFPRTGAYSASASRLAHLLAGNAKLREDADLNRYVEFYLKHDQRIEENRAKLRQIENEIARGTGDMQVLNAQKGTIENSISRLLKKSLCELVGL